MTAARWIRDRSLTLVTFGLFAVFTVGQVLTGWREHNSELTAHGQHASALTAVLCLRPPVGSALRELGE